MISKKVYAFGCSMTSYHYPTWADIIGHKIQSFENWGKAGAGNQYIFNSIVECDARNNLGPNDTVLILWSGLARLDSYLINHWKHVLNNYDNHCPDGYEILSYAYMHAVDQLLQMRQVNYRMMTWMDYDQNSATGKIYKSTLDRLTRVRFRPNNQKYLLLDQLNFVKEFGPLYQRLAGPDWPSLKQLYTNTYTVSPAIRQELDEFYKQVQVHKKYQNQKANIDTHPLPLDHLDMIVKYLPEFSIDDQTVQWIKHIQGQLLAGQPFEFAKKTPKQRL